MNKYMSPDRTVAMIMMAKTNGVGVSIRELSVDMIVKATGNRYNTRYSNTLGYDSTIEDTCDDILKAHSTGSIRNSSYDVESKNLKVIVESERNIKEINLLFVSDNESLIN
ncbi:MAG: hypothetical protein ACRCZ9_12160 [Fusobacteriaceae bacterium]